MSQAEADHPGLYLDLSQAAVEEENVYADLDSLNGSMYETISDTVVAV